MGAILNAHLNRRRDDRLRSQEAQSVRSALAGELGVIRKALSSIADHLEKNAPDDDRHFLMPDPAKLARIMPSLLPKFGLLTPDTVGRVVEVYATIEQVKPTLLAHGGAQHRNELHIVMPINAASKTAVMVRTTAAEVGQVISILTPQAKKGRHGLNE